MVADCDDRGPGNGGEDDRGSRNDRGMVGGNTQKEEETKEQPEFRDGKKADNWKIPGNRGGRGRNEESTAKNDLKGAARGETRK